MKLANPRVARDASCLLQEIEDDAKSAGIQHTARDFIEPKIQFPRGYIREAEWFRQKYPCKKRAIANNIAYTLQFHDVMRWLLNRTDIGLSARRMILKYGIVSAYSVIEAIVWVQLSSMNLSPGKKFPKNLKKLLESGIIDQELHEQLKDVHKKREKIHLELYALKGEESYNNEDWNDAVGALENLRLALDNHRNA